MNEHGWLVLNIEPATDAGALCAFTVGLTARGLPELIVYSLAPVTAAHMLNDIASRMLAGEQFADGQVIPGLVEGDFCLYDTTHLVDPLGGAFTLYGEQNVRVRQLVVPDMANRLPWQCGYTLPRWAHPVLFDAPHDPAHDSGHREARDLGLDPHLAVIVSRTIVEDDQPVLAVHHEDQDELCFLDGSGQFEADDLVALCLHHMLEQAPELLEVVRTLPPGIAAERHLVGDTWQFHVLEDEE